MDLHRKYVCVLILIMSSNKIFYLHGSPTEGSVVNTELTGQELIRMGNVMNKPLLSLLGATFVKTEMKVNKELSERIGTTEKKLQDDIEKLTLNSSKEREFLKMELCKQTRCMVWTEWSRCSAYKNETFGARTRSRACGGKTTVCPTNSAETVETDYQICQGKSCKHTFTNNNYCIQLYKSAQKSQKDAQADCHKDGGYLMNIDSALTAKDIEDYFNKISFTADVWIDGTRSLPNGVWTYEYGPKDYSFDTWSSSEPGPSDNCKIFHYSSNKWYWWGRSCTSNYNTLCEFF